ncbi:MAG TPA: hypothetical protein VNJ12_04430 [Candidatus Dormibacteraeota bacterium]|nr:hypothetical protein [Candidatus Dormibacteraeota bacterium]
MPDTLPHYSLHAIYIMLLLVIAVATALVIPARQIVPLGKEWDTLKNKEGFSDFSMSEFVYKNPKSEFADWDEDKRKRVYSRVRQITKKYGLAAFSVAVNKSHYDEIMPKALKSRVGRHHYTWAVHHLLSFLSVWRFSGIARPPFEYVFHWMEEPSSKADIEAAMERAEGAAAEAGVPGGYTNYSFRKSKEIPGLQCVDTISWVCYQLAQFALRDKPMHEFATVGWEAFEGDRAEKGWLRAVTILPGDLRKWVEQVMADPSNLDGLQRLEEKLLARRSTSQRSRST